MSDNQIIEETIHKRLQYKFDKSLTKFAADYLRLWQTSDPAQSKKMAALLLEDVALLEFENFKNVAALKSIDRNAQNNESELGDINQNVQETLKDISQLNAELKKQQSIRKNKEEYNEIAGSVRQYEPRTEMERRIAETEAQIDQLQESHREQMEVIRKQEQYLRMTLSAFSCLIDCGKKRQ